MKKKLLLFLFLIPALVITLTGCGINIGGGDGDGGINIGFGSKEKTLTCSVVSEQGFEKYGNIQYNTQVKFGSDDVAKDVDLVIHINFTKINPTTAQFEQMKKLMDDQFCGSLFTGATCSSKIEGNAIVYNVSGKVGDVYHQYGSYSDNKLESVQNYLETTEGMTCTVK